MRATKQRRRTRDYLQSKWLDVVLSGNGTATYATNLALLNFSPLPTRGIIRGPRRSTARCLSRERECDKPLTHESKIRIFGVCDGAALVALLPCAPAAAVGRQRRYNTAIIAEINGGSCCPSIYPCK